MNKIQDYLPKVESNTPKIEPLYVTPYLSEQAKQTAKEHRRQGKPVFVKAMQHYPGTAGYCKNCGGGGVIYLTMISAGPFKDVPAGKKSITWFDGDELNGKGWYIIDRTMTFPCQECASNPATAT